MDLLGAIGNETDLGTQYALKGGTALNLFYFNVPRVSVDIDLNYIGFLDLVSIKADKPILEECLQRIYQSQGMVMSESQKAHAGGKYQLTYPSVLNQGKGSIEVYLNYMLRLPLFPMKMIASQLVGGRKTRLVHTVSFEEAAAGKFSALMDRNAARDLFDAYHILFAKTSFSLY